MYKFYGWMAIVNMVNQGIACKEIKCKGISSTQMAIQSEKRKSGKQTRQ